MSGTTWIDWTDVSGAAKALAGNWREFDSFAWFRAHDLTDAEYWLIYYTSNRDSGLLAQSNEKAINDRLQKYAEGDDPDVVFERHSSWLCGHLDGFSLRVCHPDGSITPAFEEFCRLQERLEDYPLLDEEDFSRREYEATLENYRSGIGPVRTDLPDGWEEQVYRHFCDTSQYRYVESHDDQGGWAPREKIIEALTILGLIKPKEDDPIIV